MKSTFYFVSKVILNSLLPACAILSTGKKNATAVLLGFSLSLVCIPAFLCAVCLSMGRASPKAIDRVFLLTLPAELVLLVLFYYAVRSYFFYFHVGAAVLLDFLTLLGLRSFRRTDPPFQLGRCRVPIMEGSRVVFRRMETVYVLGVEDGTFLVRGHSGERRYVDQRLIEEENELVI